MKRLAILLAFALLAYVAWVTTAERFCDPRSPQPWLVCR